MARSRIEIEGDALECQSDGDLAVKAAQGDREAFEELYRRHARTAMRVAYRVTGNIHDASDAVSEAFARVMQALPQGRLDQPSRFRPYLMSATRHAAVDVLRRSGRQVPSDGDLEPAQTFAGPPEKLIDAADSSMVALAFRDLPERWRSVLWLTEVEAIPAREAAPMLGLSPNGVAQLAVRARNGLRERYLQAHLREVDGECRQTVERLGAYVGGGLSPREVARVDQHVAACDACRTREGDLQEIGTTLRRALAPVPAVGSGVARWLWRMASRAHHAATSVMPGTDQAVAAKIVPVGVAAAGVFVAGLAGAGVVGTRLSTHAPTASQPAAIVRPASPAGAAPAGASSAATSAPIAHAARGVTPVQAVSTPASARQSTSSGQASSGTTAAAPAPAIAPSGTTRPGGDTSLPADHRGPADQPLVGAVPTTVPTTVPDLTTVPTTVPDLTTVPTTVPDLTTVPTTLPDLTTVPTTLPDIDLTTLPSTVELQAVLGAAGAGMWALEWTGSDDLLPPPSAPGLPV
jgi:RNA polymerase sigma factor (sigma-70 family)